MVLQTYRVDISFDQIVFLWLQNQIISSEGDDPRLPTASRYLWQAVWVQASTGQDITTPHLVALLKQYNANDGNNRTQSKHCDAFICKCLTFLSLIAIGYFIPANKKRYILRWTSLYNSCLKMTVLTYLQYGQNRFITLSAPCWALLGHGNIIDLRFSYHRAARLFKVFAVPESHHPPVHNAGVGWIQGQYTLQGRHTIGLHCHLFFCMSTNSAPETLTLQYGSRSRIPLASTILRSRTLFFMPRSYRAFRLGISSCSTATISCKRRNTLINTKADTTQWHMEERLRSLTWKQD